MVSSYSNNISTHLRSSYLRRGNYTIQFFGQNLDVAVTSNSSAVRSWINRSLHIHRRRLYFHRRGSIIVGLGTQWRSFQSNQYPATIQICIGHRILIFQIVHSRSIPTALSRLLSDHRITFVGYNIGHDCRLLRSCHNLVVASTVELRSVSGMGNASMERMAERILGLHGVDKPKWIAMSNWDALQLSVDQVQYAALDAYLSFQLGLQLVARSSVTKRAEHNVAFHCNVVSAEKVGHYMEDGNLIDPVFEDALPSRESGLCEDPSDCEIVSDGRYGIKYSEEDELDSDSGPVYFEEDGESVPDSGSGLKYSEEDKSDSYSGHVYFEEDEERVPDGRSGLKYFEEDGSDSYSGPVYFEEDGSNSYSGPGYVEEYGLDADSGLGYVEEYGLDAYSGCGHDGFTGSGYFEDGAGSSYSGPSFS